MNTWGRSFLVGVLLFPMVTHAGFFSDLWDRIFPSGSPTIEAPREPEVLIPLEIEEPEGREPLEISEGGKAEIVFVSPQKGEEGVQGKRPLTFLFSDSVFALENPETVAKRLTGKISMTPSIKGSWQILGTTGLLFEPSEPWANSTEYKILVPEDLGIEKIEHYFKTPRLSFKNFSAQELIFEKPLVIEFNQKISLEEAAKIQFKPDISVFVEYYKEAGETDFSQKKVAFTPQQNWPGGQKYSVVLPKGTRGMEGPLGTESDVTRTFQTIEKFHLRRAHLPQDVFGRINLNFSAPMVPEEFLDHLTISPKPSAEVWARYRADFLKNWGDQASAYSFSLASPEAYWNPLLKTTIQIDSKLKDTYGRPLGKDLERSFQPSFPTTFRKVFIPEYYSVLKSGSTFKPTFWYSGDIHQVTVEVKESVFQKQTWIKTFEVEPSPTSEKFWSVDLEAEFPEIMDAGGLRPGVYEMQVKAHKKSRILDRWGQDYWGPQEHRTMFVVSDFAVGLKQLPKQDFEVSVSAFSEDPEMGKDFSVEVLDRKRNQDFLEPLKTYEPFQSGQTISLSGQPSYSQLFLVRSGDRVGFGSPHFVRGIRQSGQSSFYETDQFRSVNFSDRPIYKPGDTVFFKSILREIELSGEKFGLKKARFATDQKYHLEILGPRWERVAELDFEGTEASFDGLWVIPEGVSHGNYRARISSSDRSLGEIPFFVGDYRKSNFLVTAEFGQDQVFWKESVNAKLQANYAFGGRLSGKKVNYSVHLSGTQPCLFPFLREGFWGGGRCQKEEKILSSGSGVLNGAGEFEKNITLDFKPEEGDPIWNQLVFRATVFDGSAEENSVEITAPFRMSTQKIELDPAPYYFEKGAEGVFKGRVVDIEGGKVSPQKIRVQLQEFQGFWPIERTEKNLEAEDLARWEKEILSDENGRFEMVFEVPEEAGNYEITFTTQDSKGRETKASQSFWVPGVSNKKVSLGQEDKTILFIPDQESYRVGERVELFVPHSEWEILQSRATLERGEILRDLSFDPKTQMISFTAEPWMAPNVFVGLFLEGVDELGNPHMKFGTVNVSVTDPARSLDVSLEPTQSKYRPGETVELEVFTTADGQKVPAELTIMMVDETLLALKSQQWPDLLTKFLADLPLGTSFAHALANFISQTDMDGVVEKISSMTLRDSQDDFAAVEESMVMMNKSVRGFGGGAAPQRSMMMADMAESEMMRQGGVGMDGGAIETRQDFVDTTAFLAKVSTDQYGKATVKIPLPDNLTTWRITAVGHTESNEFGQTDTQIFTSLPLLISEIVPNFFQRGDRMKVGVLIRRDDSIIAQEVVEVKLIMNDKLRMTNDGVAKKMVNIGKEGRVFFDVEVPKEGFDWEKDFEEVEFGFSVRGKTSGQEDQVLLTRKVYPPTISMTAAEFLRVEADKFIAMKPDFKRAIASKVFIKFFLSIADKLENLIEISHQSNYGCAEQRFSSSTAMMIQKDFDDLLGRESEEVQERVLEKNRDYIEESFVPGGGYSFWKHERSPNVWVTTQILEWADIWKRYGAEIDPVQLEASQKWLGKQIIQDCDRRKNWRCISDSTRQNAGSVLAQAGALSSKDLNALSRWTKSSEAKIWWLKSARILAEQNKSLMTSDRNRVEAFWEDLNSLVVARDRYIFWEELKNYWSFYSQNERLTALIFDEMVAQNRLENFQPKVARYLAETRATQLSGNTALRVLVGLTKWGAEKEVEQVGSELEVLEVLEKQGRHSGRKIATETLEKLTDIKYLEREITEEDFSGIKFLTLNEKPFYADLELKEVFPAHLVSPVARGFWMERDIFEVEDEDFETPLTDLEVGKNYRVRLKVITNTSHRQVMVEDKIPSGAEFVNSEFNNSNKNFIQNGSRNRDCFGWCRPNFVHQEFHSEKARFFADYLSPGTYEVQYMIKTRLPGEFDLLPARVEEMYYPEVFATTQGERIVISE